MIRAVCRAVATDRGHCGRFLPGLAASPFSSDRLPKLEHDAEKACPALDAGWVPVSRLREAHGTVRRLA
jgi:hypothetical protein